MNNTIILEFIAGIKIKFIYTHLTLASRVRYGNHVGTLTFLPYTLLWGP